MNDLPGFLFLKIDPEKDVIFFFPIPAGPACGHCLHFYTFFRLIQFLLALKKKKNIGSMKRDRR